MSKKTIKVNKGKKGGRYYSPPDRPKVKYPSVTTVISDYYFNPGLKKWKENVGREESDKISMKASTLGTNVHKLNELYFTKHIDSEYQEKIGEYEEEALDRHELFKPLLNVIEPIYTEQQLIWEDISPMNPSEKYGFGGTTDLMCKITDPSIFYEDKACETPYTGFSKKGELYVVADYKNWKSPKYASSLVHTCLQLSAYTAMVNRNTQDLYGIRDALILGSAPKGLYLYHIGAREVVWYWSWFKQILHNFYEFTDENTITFNWKTFENYSLGRKRVYNPETGGFVSEPFPENYLCKRIYIKDGTRQDNVDEDHSISSE